MTRMLPAGGRSQSRRHLRRRRFDSTVIVLILVSVITVTIDTLPTLSPGVRTVLSWSEVVIVGLFTIEYGLRVGTAPRKLQ